MRYRVKEYDGWFYPEYNCGWKTLWSWCGFAGPEFKVLYRGEGMDPVTATQVGKAEFVKWRFRTLEKASAFIEVVKIYRTRPTVIYHDSFSPV